MDIILSGAIGDHSIAVMGQRFGLDLSDSLKTDCAPLNNMVHAVLDKVGLKWLYCEIQHVVV